MSRQTGNIDQSGNTLVLTVGPGDNMGSVLVRTLTNAFVAQLRFETSDDGSNWNPQASLFWIFDGVNASRPWDLPGPYQLDSSETEATRMDIGQVHFFVFALP